MIKFYSLQGVNCYPNKDVESIIIHDEQLYFDGEHTSNKYGVLCIKRRPTPSGYRRSFTLRHERNLIELKKLKENFQEGIHCEISFELELE